MDNAGNTRAKTDDGCEEYQLGPGDARNASGVQALEREVVQLVGFNKEDKSQIAVPGFGDFNLYFRERKRKLAEQAELRATREQKFDPIFAGVTFHINGYTQPSHYELKLLLIDRGGKFLHYLSKTQVTHIIASSLTMAKEKELRNYKVVRPEWVVDSVRAGRQLSWHRYKLIGQGNTGVPTNPGQASLDLEAWGAMSLLSSTQNCTASSPAVGAAEPSDAQQQQQQQQPQPQPQVPPKTTVVVDRFGEGLNRSWVRKNIASDKDFIQRYYANSRLHHLSVWKADMKDYVAQLRQKYKQPTAKEKGSPESRIIMHVDFDCFFVSASLLLHPHLKDKPVAVCHSQQQQPQEEQPDSANSGSTGMSGRSGGSSQIASCNYIARSFGIRNGMFMGPARRLCPSLTTVPYHFDEYKRISQIFYEEVTKVADETQAVSIDEALLDVTEVVNREYQGNPELLAQHIRQLVQEKTRCTVSIGIGPSILLARVATTRAKPDGVYSLDTNRFMNMDMKVNDLPGAGHTIEDKLAAHGIRAVADVRSASLQQLQTICGEKMGTRLYNFSRGIDDRVLESDKPRQAFGADIGWGIRFSNQDEADGFVRRLTEEVCKSMSSAKRTGRSVTLKIKKRQEGQGRPEKFLGHGICDSLSRSTTLPQPTDDPARIASACIDLLRQMSINPLDIRSVGIQVQRLSAVEAGADIGSLLARPKAPKGVTSSESSRRLEADLPSASQLDITVISELPLSIQQELQAAYQQLDPNIDIGISKPAGPASARRRPDRKPSHGSGYSGRGQPRKLAFSASGVASNPKPKHRSQSLVQAFRKAESLDSVMPSQMDGGVWESLPMGIRREVAREYLRSKPQVPREKPSLPDNQVEAAEISTSGDAKQEDGGGSCAKDEDEDKKGKSQTPPAPMLFGKSDMAGVKRLIKDWVASSETGPYEEDIAELASYTESLVRSHDLARAEGTLAYLKFCVQSRSSAWKDALAAVLSRTNTVCLEMYNARIVV